MAGFQSGNAISKERSRNGLSASSIEDIRERHRSGSVEPFVASNKERLLPQSQPQPRAGSLDIIEPVHPPALSRQSGEIATFRRFVRPVSGIRKQLGLPSTTEMGQRAPSAVGPPSPDPIAPPLSAPLIGPSSDLSANGSRDRTSIRPNLGRIETNQDALLKESKLQSGEESKDESEQKEPARPSRLLSTPDASLHRQSVDARVASPERRRISVVRSVKVKLSLSDDGTGSPTSNLFSPVASPCTGSQTSPSAATIGKQRPSKLEIACDRAVKSEGEADQKSDPDKRLSAGAGHTPKRPLSELKKRVADRKRDGSFDEDARREQTVEERFRIGNRAGQTSHEFNRFRSEVVQVVCDTYVAWSKGDSKLSPLDIVADPNLPSKSLHNPLLLIDSIVKNVHCTFDRVLAEPAEDEVPGTPAGLLGSRQLLDLPGDALFLPSGAQGSFSGSWDQDGLSNVEHNRIRALQEENRRLTDLLEFEIKRRLELQDKLVDQ